MIRNLDSTLLILFLLFHSRQHLSSQDVGTNSSQPICPTSFSCSNLGSLSFPFYASGNSGCGLFEVDCNQLVPKIQLTQDYPSYDLVQVMPGSTSSHFVHVRDNHFANQITNKSCDSLTYRFPPNSSSLSYNISPTLSVLKCVKTLGLVDGYFSAVGEYYVFDKCNDYNYYYTYSNGYISSNTNLPLSCSVVVLPGNSPYTLPKETDFNDLFQLLTSELNLVVQVSDRCQECHRRGGQCSNENQEFWCKYSTRNTKKENPRNTVIKSALATLAIGTAVILILLVLCYRFKIFSKRDAENYSNLEAIIKTHESLAPKRYSYSHVKKTTDSFKVKVGEGGYGSVYRGKLQNGNDVAVKVLNELKGSGEDLVNELASISKTCHVNIVSLVGFCFEGRHKALIYEYMPNGSLEKYIYNPSTTTGSQLEWKKLYFFDSVYKQVVSNKNLVLSGVLDVQDKEVAKKMILVGLWCTQSDPSSRPSISKVLDMLEGDLGAVCFFCGKMSAVCGPHLQASAGEEVDQMSAVCKEKMICFFFLYKSSSHT
ncbi:putative glycerophosphodiester phosphodiesterase, protein kinase RLK-Pelle-LRK10L-2 family [Helianthus debilis subsp. tardiflorus]